MTSWRDLPSLVVARDGTDVTKSPLAPRFQEAIDEAAMRLGMAGSDAYLEQWQHGEWQSAEGAPDAVVAEVAERLDNDYDDARLQTLLEV